MAIAINLLFVAIFGILSFTTSDVPSTAATLDPYGCQEFNCTSVNSPICSTTGKELSTDLNRCFYNQRLLCFKEWSPNGPSTTFLHHGACRGTKCLGKAPRIYKPVCSSVDGVAETDANKWLYQIKRKCANNFRKQEESKKSQKSGDGTEVIATIFETKPIQGSKPIVRFLHNGACLGNENKCWRRCTNVRRPVCGAINRRLTTERNRCILNNKIRCYNMLRNQGERAPVVKFRNNGKCRNNNKRKNKNG